MDACVANKSINIYYRHVIHQKMGKKNKKARSIWVPKVHEHAMSEIYIKFSMPPRVIMFASRRCGPERKILFN